MKTLQVPTILQLIKKGHFYLNRSFSNSFQSETFDNTMQVCVFAKFSLRRQHSIVLAHDKT